MPALQVMGFGQRRLWGCLVERYEGGGGVGGGRVNYWAALGPERCRVCLHKVYTGNLVLNNRIWGKTCRRYNLFM